MKIKIWFAFNALILVSCERLHEKIYSSIVGGAPCFRRLNGTHQAGCATPEKGAVGIVHMVDNVTDAQWLASNATSEYMAVVGTLLFPSVVEILMSHPEHVAGVLVYHEANDEPFSEDTRCPNEYASAPESQCSSTEAGGRAWNEWGTGLLRRDIPFPIFFLPMSRGEEITKIRTCYKKYNLDRGNHDGVPLCSVQLTSFMFAAVNAEVCMRRSASSAILTSNKVCDPLGDRNVYYSLFPRAKETAANKKKVTLVTARIDAASSFDGLAPGAASSVVGMVTLITAAATLAQMIPETDAHLYKHNIVWTLLNGEAFDYIGSQRLAYDLSQGHWPEVAPLAPADIALHLEVGQLGGPLLANSKKAAWPLYAFAPPNNAAQVDEILQILSGNAIQYNMTVQPKFTTNLPPSSMHSFRRILKNVTDSGELPELLLADHDEIFTNNYYNSVLDLHDTIGFSYHNISIGNNGTFISTEELIRMGNMSATAVPVKIAYLSTAVARTLYQRVVGQAYSGNISTSAHLVDEMLHCFLESQACKLLQVVEYPNTNAEYHPPPAVPVPLYVGVAHSANAPATYAGYLIALLTGTQRGENRTQCHALVDPDYSFYWMRGWNHSGVCIQTTMNFSQAISPAFTIEDYDYKSGQYSTWTESIWQAMSARVFVSATGSGARAAAIAGALSTVVAAALTLWLRRNASTVFVETTGSVVSGDAATGILRSVNC